MNMTRDGESRTIDAVVTDDGGAVIAAEELRDLGVPPGTHLRLHLDPVKAPGIRGRLYSWPDLSADDFQRGSTLAVRDLDAD